MHSLQTRHACAVLYTVVFSFLSVPATWAAADNATDGKATVHVIQGGTGSYAAMSIYMDGKYVEKLNSNTYVTITLAPGAHEISTAARSRVAMPFNVRNGDVYYIKQVTGQDGDAQFVFLSDTEGPKLLSHAQAARDGQAVALHAQPALPPLAATSTTTVPPATAEPTTTPAPRVLPLYIGVGAAKVKMKALSSDVYAAQPDAATIQDSDTVPYLFVGLRLNQYLAFEAAWDELGRYSVDTTSTTGGITDTLRVEATPIALSVAAVGTLPLHEAFVLSAKLGAYDAYCDYREISTDSATGFVDDWTETQNNIGLLYGVGATLNLTRHFGLRAQYQRYLGVVYGPGLKTDIDSLSAAVVVSF
jgi:hypothetical protein